MNKSETQKYVQGLQKENEELKKQVSELEEIYKRERKVINNLYCRCSKRSEAPFRSREYGHLRIVTNEELKQFHEEPSMHILNIREIDGEKYIKYSDYEWYRKGRENRIKELEEIIKRHKFKDTKDILKEKEELKAENAELHCEIQAMNAMPDSEYAKELEKQIKELESELSVKENLLKIKNGLCGEEIPKEITVDGFKCEIIQTAQGLYIERDRIYEIIEREKEPIKKKCAELEDRHQSDCITINQLNIALDVMTEKYQRLRGKHGL